MQIVINRLRYAPMRSHSSFDSEEVRLNQAKRHRGFRLVGGGKKKERNEGRMRGSCFRFYLAEVMKSVVGSRRNVGAVSKNVSGSTLTVSVWLVCRYSGLLLQCKDKRKRMRL